MESSLAHGTSFSADVEDPRIPGADFRDRMAILGVTVRMTPHDHLFRTVFSQPEQAAAHLRRVLPAGVSRRLDWEALWPEVPVWVDQHLRERRADLLFSVGDRTGEARLWLLYEHLSTSPPDVLLKLLGYAVRGWEAQRSGGQALWAVVPVVVFSGPAWTARRPFGAMFALPVGLGRATRPYAPNFRWHLVDLGREDPARMGLRAQGEAALFLLKHAREGGLWDRLGAWPVIPRLVAESGVDALIPLVTYVAFVEKEPPTRAALQSIERQAGRAAMEQVKSWGEQLLEQGIREGQEKGRLEGQRAVISDLLERRFGALPAEVTDRLARADADHLSRWAERLLSAATLAEVFAE